MAKWRGRGHRYHALWAGFAFVGAVFHCRECLFHKFKIGQRVSYQPSRSNFPVRWVVTVLVPEEDGNLKYRFHRSDAPEDLVVSEKHLREKRDL